MIVTYSSINDENGITVSDRTRLLIRDIDENGNINKYTSGNYFAIEEAGTLFIVDKWLIDQIDKVKFLDGELSVKEGEELIPPVKTEKELQREALLKQLAELDAD